MTSAPEKAGTAEVTSWGCNAYLHVFKAVLAVLQRKADPQHPRTGLTGQWVAAPAPTGQQQLPPESQAAWHTHQPG